MKRFLLLPSLFISALVFNLYISEEANAQNNKDALSQQVKTDILIAVSQLQMSFFESTTRDKPCYEISDYSDKVIIRTFDLMLLCRALYLGGINPQFKFIVTPHYGVSLKKVEAGEAHTSSQTIWESDINQSKVYPTVAAIERGGFEKGIYTRVDHPILQISPDVIDLNNYLGISVLNWGNDLAVLREISGSAYSTLQLSEVFKLLQQKRADYTLLNIEKTNPFEIDTFGMKLRPVIGIKVVFPESRHYIFSAKLTDSKQLQASTNKGLAIMRKSGELESILEDVAIKNTRTKDWRIINNISKENKSI